MENNAEKVCLKKKNKKWKNKWKNTWKNTKKSQSNNVLKNTEENDDLKSALMGCIEKSTFPYYNRNMSKVVSNAEISKRPIKNQSTTNPSSINNQH